MEQKNITNEPIVETQKLDNKVKVAKPGLNKFEKTKIKFVVFLILWLSSSTLGILLGILPFILFWGKDTSPAAENVIKIWSNISAGIFFYGFIGWIPALVYGLRLIKMKKNEAPINDNERGTK